MPKPFPYEDNHRVPWEYDVSLISTRIGKEEVCSNIYLGLSKLTRSGHCCTLEKLEKRRKEISKGTAEPVRNKVITKEAEEFLKIIRNSEYDVIQQLNKLPAQISILELLLSSDVHRVTESSFEGMVSMVLATNQISFTNDEPPPKGREHTLPMHIMVKCKDMIVSRVLIDNRSALNVYPMSTIESLNVDTSLIIRVFNGTLREVQGEIKLMTRVGPRSFIVIFQVIKVDSPYNMPLGRPWLHATGAVASTFHQRLKFSFEDQVITIMVKEPLTIFKETSIPYIGANAFPEAIFHNFELVFMISRASELKSTWLFTTLMVAKEMLKFGYQLGQGLGAVGHRNVSLIELPDNKGGFGLGYDPSDKELFQAFRGKKRKCISQGMSIPHSRVTFLASTEVIRLEMAQESCEEELDLACLICLCPEEFSMNAIISLGDDPNSTIRHCVLGETASHWTMEPYFVVALVG
nr:uncharacterized protein LOC111985560 [Quercus suber]